METIEFQKVSRDLRTRTVDWRELRPGADQRDCKLDLVLLR